MSNSDAPTRTSTVSTLASRISRLRVGHPLRVGVDGIDAAGKTTLADELATQLASCGRTTIRASIDGFHYPQVARRRRGALSPEGYFLDSFNYEALVGELLRPLGPGGSSLYRTAVFDFRADQVVELPVRQAPSESILVFDGVFLSRDETRDYFDYRIFVRCDFDEALTRAEKRDMQLFGSVEEVRRRYQTRYFPAQRRYLREYEPESLASVVVDNTNVDLLSLV